MHVAKRGRRGDRGRLRAIIEARYKSCLVRKPKKEVSVLGHACMNSRRDRNVHLTYRAGDNIVLLSGYGSDTPKRHPTMSLSTQGKDHEGTVIARMA